jgi:hypothetical protein
VFDVANNINAILKQFNGKIMETVEEFEINIEDD